jgi:integrase
VLGRDEIQRLLAACAPRDRLMVATALYTGLRISELLGLIWEDIDFDRGEVHVRAQLSRAHRSSPPRRAVTKTPASVRDVPLLPQLARLLADHRRRQRARPRAALLRPAPLLYASHLILGLRLDVAQTSSFLGHASPTITLNVYTHLFEKARHMREIRDRMAASPFARLLDPVSPVPVELPLPENCEAA